MSDSTGSLGETKRQTGAGDVYVQLALEYLRQGKVDVALAKAKTALEQESSNPDAHYVIALIYERLRENGLAEYHFKESIGYQSANPYSHNAYGSFLCQNGRYQEADVEFKKALENPLYKTPEVALTNAGICANRNGDSDKAETYLRQALTQNPKLALALIKMAEVSFEKGQYFNARAYLERYQAVARPTATSLWLGIRTERQLGDQDAEASYTLLLKNGFPDSPEAQQMEASVK
jgi:type IV pilus assembly protein PilF